MGAQLGAPAVWLLPVTFPMVMAFGGMLGLRGVTIPGTEIGIALSAIALGFMVFREARPKLWVAAVLVGSFAVFHGNAHGTELPAGANGVLYSIGFVMATGSLHAVGIAIGLIHRWSVGRVALRGRARESQWRGRRSCGGGFRDTKAFTVDGMAGRRDRLGGRRSGARALDGQWVRAVLRRAGASVRDAGGPVAGHRDGALGGIGRAAVRTVGVICLATCVAGRDDGVVGAGARAWPGWPSCVLTVLVGGLVAADRRLPLGVVIGLAAAVGATHGLGNGRELSAARGGMLAMSGIVCALFVLVSLSAGQAASVRAQWARVVVRVAGSWIAAIGLLMLGWETR